MQVIRCAHDRHIGVRIAEDLLDVVVGVGDRKAGRQRLCLGEIVVADGGDLHSREPPQRREMSRLRDRACANDRHPKRGAHGVFPL
jgi:hypothetical protein